MSTIQLRAVDLRSHQQAKMIEQLAVERMSHNQEFVGSDPAGCWALFFLSFLLYYLQVECPLHISLQ